MSQQQVEMVALARQNYRGRWVLRDERFMADAGDVLDLEGMRPPLAKRAAAPPRAAVDPDLQPVVAAAPQQPRPVVAAAPQQPQHRHGKPHRR